MGSFLSSPVGNSRPREHSSMLSAHTNKKLRLSSQDCNDNLRLIPYLPDEISLQILARLPRIYHLKAKSISRSWKAAIMSHELFQLRRELEVTEEWLYLLIKVEEDKLLWCALDPLSGRWQRLPAMPHVVNQEEPKRGLPGFHMGNVVRVADFIRAWLWRRENLDQLPFCGCSVGAVDGCLYVLGGFSRSSVMNHVWRYDPCLNVWQEVNSMKTSRAFGKTGLLNDKLYVVGGVNRGRDGLIPLTSAEVFDPQTGLWTELSSMPFLKAQVLPAVFLANLLKPIATGMASYRGRLYVPQSLYSWPFFFDIGGEMYDPEANSWVEMPVGMGEAWPAKQAGTKLSVVVNGDLYALDPSNSMNYGKLKKYDSQEDAWKDVIDRVPLRDVTCTESPYLLASFHGKLHVITKDANNYVAILEADLRRCIEANPSTSSSTPTDTACNISASFGEEEIEFWKVLVVKDFGAAELVSCQVLEV